MISLRGKNASDFVDFEQLRSHYPLIKSVGTTVKKKSGSEDVMLYEGDSASDAFASKFEFVKRIERNPDDLDKKIFLVVGLFPDLDEFCKSIVIPCDLMGALAQKGAEVEIVVYPPSQ